MRCPYAGGSRDDRNAAPVVECDSVQSSLDEAEAWSVTPRRTYPPSAPSPPPQPPPPPSVKAGRWSSRPPFSKWRPSASAAWRPGRRRGMAPKSPGLEVDSTEGEGEKVIAENAAGEDECGRFETRWREAGQSSQSWGTAAGPGENSETRVIHMGLLKCNAIEPSSPISTQPSFLFMPLL